MSQRLHKTFLQRVVALAGRPGDADAELLRRYSDHQDETAFAELHRRHGPLVWAACRHLLPNPADAEDAYQVTFLALVKSAGRVRNASALGAWLHGVAVRTAARLKRSAVRRRSREEKAASSEADQTLPEATWTGLMAAVHEEVERLPTPLRTAFVLCDLQGVRQPDAAAKLGWKPGTLTGRLTKARQQLTQSLKERGIAPALAAGALGVAVTAAGATLVPTAMMGIVQNYAAGAAVAPAFLHRLAREMTAMRHPKWLAAGLVVLLGLGFWLASTLLPSAGGQPAQDPFATTTQEDPGAVSTRGFVNQKPGTDKDQAAGVRYKYVPLPKGQTAGTLHNTVERLEAEARVGWEYCGSVDMSLSKSEYDTLRTGRMLKNIGGNEDEGAVYRVLVFKRSSSTTQAREEQNGRPDVTVFTLKRSSATEVAEMLVRVFGTDLNQRVAVDTRTNSVVIAASAATTARVRELVERLDRHEGAEKAKSPIMPMMGLKDSSGNPGPDGSGKPPFMNDAHDIQVFPLKNTSAADVAKVLSELYQGKSGVQVKIVADPTTNSLLVHGAKETREEIRRVLDSLDKDARKSDPFKRK